MRLKKQIEEAEIETERWKIEKEKELINPFSSRLTNEQNQQEPRCIYHHGNAHTHTQK